MIVSERMPASCTDDEVANSGRTGITIAYTEDMLSRERTMDWLRARSGSLGYIRHKVKVQSGNPLV